MIIKQHSFNGLVYKPHKKNRINEGTKPITAPITISIFVWAFKYNREEATQPISSSKTGRTILEGKK